MKEKYEKGLNQVFGDIIDEAIKNKTTEIWTQLERIGRKQERMENFIQNAVKEMNAKYTMLSNEPPSVLATPKHRKCKDRQGYDWGNNENSVLIKEVKDAISEIALKHKRTNGAIRSKIHDMIKKGTFCV